MVLAKKVLSQARKWGWFAEAEMDCPDTGTSTLSTKSVVYWGTVLILSLSKCWRRLWVLLEWYQDWYTARPGRSKTADFSLAFVLSASDPRAELGVPESIAPFKWLLWTHFRRLHNQAMGLTQTESSWGIHSVCSGWSHGFSLSGPSSASTGALPRVKDKKGGKRKRIRKEQSGIRKQRKEES